MKRNNSMTERMNKNEPTKYWRNPFKGEKCNKKPCPIQNGSVVKKQRTNMVANIRCRQKFGYLTMQIIFADRRGWDPIFRFTSTYITCILFIFSSDFLPLVHFVPFLKSRGTMPFSAGLIRREPYSCRGFFLLLLYLSFYIYRVFFSLILSTHKWLIRSPRVCCSNNM